jgi:hypothetical protein
MLIDIERTVIESIGSPAGVATEYQTLWGMLPFTGFSTPAYNSTSVLFNAGGAPISDLLLNALVINILLQGGEVPDAIVVHPTMVDRIGRIFRDQFRLAQQEITRGYLVDAFRSSLGVQLIKIIMSGYMPGPAPGATTPTPVITALDLDRLAIIPFLDQFCYLLSANTMKDADVLSLIMKLTIEPRNTGTDFGYSHQTMFNLAA